ncbi:HNH endonuclease [Azospirillum picis]|uniref:HNH nuclease domain-containing protein n=1 Tax=Azospirillum picis TaxID=488438 RepID=A0ABU0MPL6_9PROT|nr:HNH endonuclease [Azospirillum picis]MBP2301583.1 hypothetical protein [Azospirillum picis]MDQ0535415.1 hypothetical protein [Azospirillum picis]
MLERSRLLAFIGNVSITSKEACWEWRGHKSRPDGYGVFRSDGKKCYSHRLSYELFVGSIPDGMFVLHACDNPGCVNPAHLFIGTAADNATDKTLKGRARGAHSGSAHHNATLTEEQALAIKRMVCGGVKSSEAAATFGVSRSIVKDIKSGRTWRHLPP